MKKRIVLIGAGSAQFGYGTIGDIAGKVLKAARSCCTTSTPRRSPRSPRPAARSSPSTACPSAFRHHEPPRGVAGAPTSHHLDRGGQPLELWEQDWRIPQQSACSRCTARTAGPGGLFHSLRIIPPILEICADIMAICPQATVFNLSNPMSRICTTVHRAFPELKFIGMCHEIGSLPNFLPHILGVPYEALEVRAPG
ncbi:hypothetical protein [Candidatus Amarolinea dominans]|uniref:family 4 glycosyl hydrolase n=1 Tax=Candidatus Amarolinea dominans TaxID=3140696 RepID=UPI0031CC45B1